MARLARTYDGRDAVMALYGPIGLLLLPAVWIVLTLVAFAAMFHALGVSGYEAAIEMSGSSLFTLGFIRPPDFVSTCLAFVEAAFGLGLLALLIAYLPTIYSAFSKREIMVGQLATFAGNPPAGVEILRVKRPVERLTLPEGDPVPRRRRIRASRPASARSTPHPSTRRASASRRSSWPFTSRHPTPTSRK